MGEKSKPDITALRIVFGLSVILTIPAILTFIANGNQFLPYFVVVCFGAFNLLGLWALRHPNPNLTVIGFSVGLAVQLLLFVVYYFQLIPSPAYPYLYAGMYAVLMALVITSRLAVFLLWANFAVGAFLIYGGPSNQQRITALTENHVYLAHNSVQIFAFLVIAAVALRSRVEHFQQKLRDANQQLEQRVEQRTAALQSALDERTQALDELSSSKNQLVHAQKTESIGRLTGGIAHDFNNLLTVILTGTYLMREGLPDNDPNLENIEAITEAGERAAALTAQLLAFSRQDVVIPEPISLNDACTTCVKMIRRILGGHVQIQLQLHANRDTVFIDPSQLDQILINLSVNARDAMPGGGVLIVRTANSGSCVQLQVEDNGDGIAAELQSKIFEPFVTNKPKGVGTGLGLSIVAGIVEISGGDISVRSAIGSGTTFEIVWPIVDADKLQPIHLTATTGSIDGKTVLVVDDDVTILRSIKRTLQSLGYNVLTADRPTEGLKFADYEGNIDLLLSDLVMPEMDGLSFVGEFRSRRSVSVLLMTGHVPDKTIRATLVDKQVRLLNKPFRPDQLAESVRESIAKPDNVVYESTGLYK